jgi:hypothetical protein
VKDLPEAWRAAMRAHLDVAPDDDRDGCLQDVHWYSGYIGGRFQSYAIGNILSAQFYAAALQAHPDIPREIAHGEFSTLHTWLRDNVHRGSGSIEVSRLARQIRQLGDVGGDAPGLVAGEQLGRRTASSGSSLNSPDCGSCCTRQAVQSVLAITGRRVSLG